MTSSHVIRDVHEGAAWAHAQRALWTKPGLILLSGPMGAGKTQLARWILEELGFAQASSPTFAVHHRYQTKTLNVDHFDLYRLRSDDDLETTGFWEILGETDNLVVIEWSDRLPDDVYPKDRRIVRIRVDILVSGERVFIFHEDPPRS